MEDKYNAICLLFTLHDIISYSMYDWIDPDIEIKNVVYFISKFIELGGITGYGIKELIFSQYTYYFRGVSKYLLKYYDEFGMNPEKIKKYIFKYYNYVKKDAKDKIVRNYHSSFMSQIDEGSTSKYTRVNELLNPSYKSLLFCVPLGLKFWSEDDLDKLIESSFILAKLVDDNMHVLLGGFVSSLFITLGLRDISIYKWIKIMLDILESDKIKKYIDNDEKQKDYLMFLRYWNIYYDTRFVNDKPIIAFATTDLLYRNKFFDDNFRDKKYGYFGETSYFSLILHYDALISCSGVWERFLYYSTIHHGWHASAYAGALFGSVYKFNGVFKNLINDIEQHNKIDELSKKMFKSFSK